MGRKAVPCSGPCLTDVDLPAGKGPPSQALRWVTCGKQPCEEEEDEAGEVQEIML